MYALLKFDKKSFIKAFENDLSDTLDIARQIINNISDDISEKNFKRISKSLGLIINYIGYGSLISNNDIDKEVVQLILQLKKITHNYNDRIQLEYKSDYLQKMPLVNESKRVILISKDLLSGKMLSGLWIEAGSKSFDESDLLISKENGSIEYQVRSLNQIANVITEENAEKISKIYPNFVHASGHLTITDSNSNKEFFNQKVFEESGSDFNSIEKAGINSLMNLARVVSLNICG